ncbi:hypothetical protein TcYC6_0003110 [Trypanosoma cruzi]|nr:hypothetical protein TcYC6_0003110 [Trypanosoma cruzi]
MTTCRITKLQRLCPGREIHDEVSNYQVASVRPERERYMTTKSMYPRCGDGPVREIYDDESKYHAAAAAPYERYMTTNRGIHAAAAHPQHVAFVFQGTTQMCSIVRRSNLNTLRENGSRDHIFFSSVAKQAHNFIRGGFEPRRRA